MRQDRRAGLGIARSAAPQAPVVEMTGGGGPRPSRLVAERRGVDAGIEAEDRPGFGTEMADMEADGLAGGGREVVRLQAVGREPVAGGSPSMLDRLAHDLMMYHKSILKGE